MLDADAELPAEGAADARHDDADPRWRESEDLRQRVLHVEGKLRVRPHRHVPGAVPRRHRGAWLRVALMHHRRREAMLEHAVGLGPTPLEVPDPDARAIADVAVAFQDRHRRVGLPRLVDQRRPRCERRGQVVHRRQQLVLRLDGARARLGGLRRRRHHGRDGLPEIPDAVAREHRLVLHGRAVARVGNVCRGDDAAHPGEGPRAAGVHTDQPRVRLAAARDLAVEHARQREVRRVDGGARHLARRVEAGQRAADDPQAHGRAPAAASSRAASSTASTIFW